MTLKTYRGSCHCGAVQFEADLDLTQPTPIGKMYGVNLGCLEGVSEEELSRLPITYIDGRNDRMGAPEFFKHL